MRVTYVGHATVLIEDSGSAIVTDPLLRRRVGHLRRQGELPAPLPELDGVLISHLHRDHLDTPSLKRIADGTRVVVPASGVSAIRRTRLQPLPVEEGGELRLGAFRVLAVAADHPTRRTPLGQETDALGYVLTAPGGSVYLAGDTDLFEGMRAIGDLVRGPALAHKAEEEGVVAVETGAGHETEPVNIDLVPGATFTHPQVASVGMTEEQAKETGWQIKVGKFKLGGAGASVVYDDRAGLVKIVGDPEYGEILGAHIVGNIACDMISEICNVMALEGGYPELQRIIHPHPTMSEAVLDGARAIDGWAIHA